MYPVVIIPAYQPEATLITLVQQLLVNHQQQNFIIVDDGSTTPLSQEVFKTLATMPSVTLLKHATNMGKGQALKTAFNYFLMNFSADTVGVVTADADGQHLAEDITRVAQALEKTPATLWLGVRQFAENVPLRSRFGNNLTRKVFQFFAGTAVQDTQTGLRGIPRKFIQEILHIQATGYEFEMDMLMRAASEHINIGEVPIQTVYIDQNRTSHFNPLLDSLKIYFVFLRYSALSILSSVLDFSLFSICYHFSRSILISTVFARILSGTFNFIYCKRVIFKSTAKALPEALQYIGLAIAAMFLSYLLVTALFKVVGLNIYLSKIIADAAIFMTNFVVQKFLIFNKKSAVSVIE